jgi:hypothetical protein
MSRGFYLPVCRSRSHRATSDGSSLIPATRYAGSRPALTALYKVLEDTPRRRPSSSTEIIPSSFSIVSMMLICANTQQSSVYLDIGSHHRLSVRRRTRQSHRLRRTVTFLLRHSFHVSVPGFKSSKCSGLATQTPYSTQNLSGCHKLVMPDVGWVPDYRSGNSPIALSPFLRRKSGHFALRRKKDPDSRVQAMLEEHPGGRTGAFKGVYRAEASCVVSRA